MIGSAGGLEVLGLGVVVVFAPVMVVGLRFSRRAGKHNLREINAAAVCAQLGGRAADDEELLYGVWLTAMHEVALVVRGGHDLPLGTIARRPSDTTIEIGSGRFVVVDASGLSESAERLCGWNDSAGTPLCRFDARDWGGAHVASYVAPGGGAFTMRAPRVCTRQRGALSIVQGGHAIGRLCTLGGPEFNRGSALLLPACIRLSVQLFMLWQGIGIHGRRVARRVARDCPCT